MMDQTEKEIIRNIDRHRASILAFAHDLEQHPEPGFEETRTASCVARFLSELGLPVQEHLALTGVKADLQPEKPGPNITLIGELDAIGCKTHPMADRSTGVAHACGHHAQLAAMVGAAAGLCGGKVREKLDGSVSFLAVPAEEYIDAEKRKRMQKKGVGFPGSGKSELIRTGVFDDTDLVLTSHVHMVSSNKDFYLGNPACNGFTAEMVTVKGKAAHAAIDPWDGVNALSIASSAIQMMGLMRETFREEDHVRLHNVIRRAGNVINTVPEDAVIETKVRAASLERILEIREMVDRAYDGAAYAFGGKIHREILQGYMPIRPRPADSVLVEAAKELGVTYEEAGPFDFNNACTDVGDLTHLFPVLNFTFGGFAGTLHSKDFCIKDEELAYITTSKMMALVTYRLLKNQAEEAKQMKRDFCPVFTRESYVEYIRRHFYQENTQGSGIEEPGGLQRRKE